MKKQPLTPISFLIDQALKDESKKLFKELGLNLTDAIRIFLIQSLRYNGIPFEIKGPDPDEEMLKFLEEVKNKQCSKAYGSAEEMFADLEKEFSQEIDEE